jgi:hypothetical protein
MRYRRLPWQNLVMHGFGLWNSRQRARERRIDCCST